MDLSSLNTFQQSILFALLILGHVILISITVLLVRKRAFQLKIKSFSDECVRKGFFRHASKPGASNEGADNTHDLQTREVHETAGTKAFDAESRSEEPAHTTDDDRIRWVDDDQVTVGHPQSRHHHHHHRVFPMAGVGARLDLNNHPRDVARTVPLADADDDMTRPGGSLKGTQKYFSSSGSISRNSQFHGLTPEEREQLGGVEYKAVSVLSVIVALYWGLFLIIGIVGMGGWLEANHPEIPRANGLSPFWTGAFFAVSAFVNSGMSLLDANMTALQTKYAALPLQLPVNQC